MRRDSRCAYLPSSEATAKGERERGREGERESGKEGDVKSAVCALRNILRIGPRGVFLGVALGGPRGARAWALTVVV